MKHKRKALSACVLVMVLSINCIRTDIINAEAESVYTKVDYAETVYDKSTDNKNTDNKNTEVKGADVLRAYKAYTYAFESISNVDDIEKNNYQIFEEETFPYIMESFGEEEVQVIPAIEKTCSRMALFIADLEGNILYKTNQLATNYLSIGQLAQPVKDMATISFADVNMDGLTDIVLITNCVNSTGDYAGKEYKTGDVLFQSDKSFYRDYRISDKINRYDMNKSAGSIISYVRDGQSVEYLYTAKTYDELIENGFKVFEEQSYTRNFEKLGKLKVVPGTARISQFDVFMVFLVNESGEIIWSFQPMGDYDNLYALKGVSSGRDLDGDGLKDIVILARYSYEGDGGILDIEYKCSIYYQRTGGFDADTDFDNYYSYKEGDTMEDMVWKIREYWGWMKEDSE